MKIEWDEAKNQQNIAKHGVGFEMVIECDWDEAVIDDDLRQDYGESRYTALVPLNGRIHQVAFTVRNEHLRIISFRKANKRERRGYGY